MQPPDDSLRQTNLKTVVEAEAAGQADLDAFPLRLTLDLIADCNLRCPHCEFTARRVKSERQNLDPVRELALPDLEMVAEAVFPHIQVLVPSVVGEPMMYTHWERLLDLVQHHGVFLDMVTNGTYLDHASLERMEPVLARMNLSMDGATPKSFNMLRAPADFDDVVARMKVVRDWRKSIPVERRPEVWITSVLTTQWLDELPEMVRLGAELEVDGVGFCHLIAVNQNWERFQPNAEPERTDDALRAAAETAREVGLSVQLPRLFSGEDLTCEFPSRIETIPRVEIPPEPNDGRPYFCKYLWRELFVSLNGDVAVCCGQGRPLVGNLREEFDVQKFMAHPTIVKMRQGTIDGNLHPVCASCHLLAMFGNVSYEDTNFRAETGRPKG